MPLAAHYGDRAAAELDSVAANTDPNDPAAFRHLVTHEISFPQSLAPVWPQAAVSRPCHRIFRDAYTRREES